MPNLVVLYFGTSMAKAFIIWTYLIEKLVDYLNVNHSKRNKNAFTISRCKTVYHTIKLNNV